MFVITLPLLLYYSSLVIIAVIFITCYIISKCDLVCINPQRLPRPINSSRYSMLKKPTVSEKDETAN